MKHLAALSVFLLFGLSLSADFVAVSTMGSDVLQNMNLGHITNLRLDASVSSSSRIWFTAGHGAPNLYFAQFTVSGPLTSPATSPFAAGAASPFISIDAAEGYVVGIALPSPVSGITFQLNATTQVLQGTYSILNHDVLVSQSLYRTYQFASVTLPMNASHAYLTGWAFDANNALLGMVAARASLALTTAALTIDIVNDILFLPQLPNSEVCYDIYTSTYKPFISVKAPSKYLVIAVPGICSSVFEIILPNAADKFKDAMTSRIELPQGDSILSATFDHEREVLWFAMRESKKNQISLKSLNTKTVSQQILPALSVDFTCHPVLTSANDVGATGLPINYLILSGAGCIKAMRYLYDPTAATLKLNAVATLGSTFNQVDSAFYSKPFFFYSTNEPNSKLVRVPSTSFCAGDCGTHQYCSQHTCSCYPGLVPDATQKALTCISPAHAALQTTVGKQVGTIATMSTLFAVALIIALVGWYFWFRARQRAYSSL
jgi:hypothetical protein